MSFVPFLVEAFVSQAIVYCSVSPTNPLVVLSVFGFLFLVAFVCFGSFCFVVAGFLLSSFVLSLDAGTVDLRDRDRPHGSNKTN